VAGLFSSTRITTCVNGGPVTSFGAVGCGAGEADAVRAGTVSDGCGLSEEEHALIPSTTVSTTARADIAGCRSRRLGGPL